MAGLFTTPLVLQWQIAGAVAVGDVPQRRLVPFDHEVVGVAISANTAPTGANLIVDIHHGANGAAAGALTSIWGTNNGTGGKPDNRPTLVAGSLDQAGKAAGTTTVAPLGTDPALSGQSSGVSTTYVNYDEFPFLAVPDPNPSAAVYGFAGNSPIQEGFIGTISVNPTEPGSANQQVAPANVGFRGVAGDVYLPHVVQVGSTVAGSDLSIILLLQAR